MDPIKRFSQFFDKTVKRFSKPAQGKDVQILPPKRRKQTTTPKTFRVDKGSGFPRIH